MLSMQPNKQGVNHEKIINILLIAILSAVLIGLVLFVINFGKDILTKNSTETKT